MSAEISETVSSGLYLPETDKFVTKPDLPQDYTRHYITSVDGHTPAFEPFIKADAYTEALGSIVVKCVDVIIMDTDKGEVLIATRKQEPMAGAWLFGGRKRAGESNAETAVKNMRREFNHEIDPAALVDTRRQYDMSWDTRAQPSSVNSKGEVVNGSHMSSAVYLLPVDKDSMNLGAHNEEFGKVEWKDLYEVLSAPPGTYHPGLVAMITDALDSFTAPAEPRDLDEAIDRAANHLSSLEAQKRQRDQSLQNTGRVMHLLIDKI